MTRLCHDCIEEVVEECFETWKKYQRVYPALTLEYLLVPVDSEERQALKTLREMSVYIADEEDTWLAQCTFWYDGRWTIEYYAPVQEPGVFDT
jgi:hypothetical protein